MTNVKSTAAGAPDEAALSASLSTKIGSKAILAGDMNTTASASDSIAIGNNTRVTAAGAVNDISGVAGQRSIAIGLDASTTMANSIAMGYGAIVQNTAASTNTPASAIAIGTGAAAMGNRSIAIGSQAGSTNSNGFDNVVVGISSGQNIQPVAAANNGGVAVNGSSNVAFGVNTGNNVTGNSNSAFGAGAGNNVGPNADSTKANCLFAPYYCYGGGGNGTNNAAFGNGSGSNVSGALNAGVGWRAGANVNGFNNTGIGPLAGFTVTGSGNVGIGSNSGAYVTGMKNTGVGNYAGRNVKGDSNTAIGDGAGSYVTGSGNLAMGQAAGTGTSTAVLTVDRSTAVGNRAVAYGNDAIAMGTNAVAGVAGQNTSVVGSIAIGSRATSTGAGSVAFGEGAVANQANSVALGRGSVASAPNTVSVGAPGAERRITNVAPGIALTDAVNVGQMQAGIGALQPQIDSLNQSVQRYRTEARQGIAAAMALTPAPLPSMPGKISWALNGADFMGQFGFGGSLALRLDVPFPLALTAGYAYGSDDAHGGRVGLQGEF